MTTSGKRAGIALALAVSLSVIADAQPGKGDSDVLNSDIGRPQRATYGSISDARDWHNPFLIVQPDGVEVRSSFLTSGRRTVPVEHLRATLVALPIAAWPYGHVVAAQDNGLREGDGSHDELIRRNHSSMERVLKRLRLHVEWWPS